MADDDDDREKTWKDFKEAVNMTASEIEEWLDTDDSKEVGQKKDGKGESTGHESGRRIVEILRKRKADLTDADVDQMHRTISYVARHSKQRPSKEDVKESKWRYSLMNWGNDPLK